MSDNPYKRPKVEIRRQQSYLRNGDVSKRDINQLKEYIKTLDTKIAILDEKINLLNEKSDIILTKVRQTDNNISRMNDYMVSHIDALNTKLDNIVLIIESKLTSPTPLNMDITTDNGNYNYFVGSGYYS